ncbi:hypothetical protein ACHAPU_002279 [Fusarium lateritium]
MASFLDLPGDVMFIIMEYCNSVEDIYSLVTTQPGALWHFLAYRHRFIKICVQDLKSRHGELLPIQFVFAARLRHLRQQKEFYQSTVEKAEQMMLPIFDECMQHQYPYALDLSRLSLSALNALSLLGRDAEKQPAIFSFYSVLCYVHDQHRSMVLDVIQHLDKISQHSSANKALKMELIGVEGAQACLTLLILLCRFQSRSQQDMDKYTHYLTSQGLSMLLKLRNMTIEEKTLFVLWSFDAVSQSPNTLVKKHKGTYTMEPREEGDGFPALLEELPPKRKAFVEFPEGSVDKTEAAVLQGQTGGNHLARVDLDPHASAEFAKRSDPKIIVRPRQESNLESLQGSVIEDRNVAP